MTYLFGLLPEADFYTSISCRVYRKGERIDINSQSFQNLGTKTTYISIDGTVGEINDYNKCLDNDIVLGGITHMHKNNNGGYSGRMDSALILVLLN